MVDLRYSRQARLAEIGTEGQARLAATVANVSLSGPAGEIEAQYLVAAGVGTVHPFGGMSTEGLCTFGISDPAALDFARGAHAALRTIRGVVLRGQR